MLLWKAVLSDDGRLSAVDFVKAARIGNQLRSLRETATALESDLMSRLVEREAEFRADGVHPMSWADDDDYAALDDAWLRVSRLRERIDDAVNDADEMQTLEREVIR